MLRMFTSVPSLSPPPPPRGESRVSRPRAEAIKHTVEVFRVLRELETRPMKLKKLKLTGHAAQLNW